jgi:hypothetical protein
MKIDMTAACATATIATWLFMLPLAASGAEPAQAAYWAQHDEIDYLDNLPRLYGCDELYYKYRDVLLRLGARPGMKIYAYGCVHDGGVAAKVRPHVNLTYEVPKALPPAVTGQSAFSTKLVIVHLRPGHPKSLDSGDCILVQDMRDTVLASFSSHVDTGGPNCSATHSARRQFDLTVQTLIPLAGQSAQDDKPTSGAPNS